MGLSEEKNPLLLRLLFYFPQSFITGRFGRYLHLSAPLLNSIQLKKLIKLMFNSKKTQITQGLLFLSTSMMELSAACHKTKTKQLLWEQEISLHLFVVICYQELNEKKDVIVIILRIAHYLWRKKHNSYSGCSEYFGSVLLKGTW